MSDQGFGQQPNLSKIHQDCLSVLVDTEVAEVHVGLGEHEAIIGYHDGGMHRPSCERELCMRLARVGC